VRTVQERISTILRKKRRGSEAQYEKNLRAGVALTKSVGRSEVDDASFKE
jgi:hypothetical protein